MQENSYGLLIIINKLDRYEDTTLMYKLSMKIANLT